MQKENLKNLAEKLIESKSIAEVRELNERIVSMIYGKVNVEKIEAWNYYVERRIRELKNNLDYKVSNDLRILSEEFK